VSSRYERGSVIVTSDKACPVGGEIFGDAVVAAAMIDRLMDHAEIVSLKGESYCFKDKKLAEPPGKRVQFLTTTWVNPGGGRSRFN
jgi:DNA replication protein DnaC